MSSSLVYTLVARFCPDRRRLLSAHCATLPPRKPPKCLQKFLVENMRAGQQHLTANGKTCLPLLPDTIFFHSLTTGMPNVYCFFRFPLRCRQTSLFRNIQPVHHCCVYLSLKTSEKLFAFMHVWECLESAFKCYLLRGQRESAGAPAGRLVSSTCKRYSFIV